MGSFFLNECDSSSSKVWVSHIINSSSEDAIFFEYFYDSSYFHITFDARVGSDIVVCSQDDISFCDSVEIVIEFQDFFFGWMRVFDKKFLYFRVLVWSEYDSEAVFSISSSSSYFLIIVLNTSREIIVDDKSDIFFIDSHTKSIGSYDDFIGVIHEVILHLLPWSWSHSSCIFSSFDTISCKVLIHFIYSLSTRTIDDSWSRSFWEYFERFLIFFVFFPYFSDDEDDIFSIKPSCKYIVIIKSKPLYYICFYFLCSCCCERDDRKLFYVLKVFYKSLYLHIARSKIMSPLTDTVSFIYGYEWDIYILKYAYKLARVESLGSDIEKLDSVIVFTQFVEDFLLLWITNRWVNKLCLYS